MRSTQPDPHSLCKSALLARQAELNSRLAAVETALDETPSQDWDDLAIDREDDEVLEATGLSGQHELRQIAAALGRLEAGTYGTCAKCGATISAARLDALPSTPFCQVCAT